MQYLDSLSKFKHMVVLTNKAQPIFFHFFLIGNQQMFFLKDNSFNGAIRLKMD